MPSWTIVDRTVELLASGDATLVGLVNTGVMSGMVNRLDNSDGVTEAFVVVSGATTTIAQHTARAWVRLVSGAATATNPRLNFDYTNDQQFSNTTFVRVHVTTPGVTSRVSLSWAIFAGPGQIVEWVGEETFLGAVLHDGLIVVEGAAASATVTADTLPSWLTFDPVNRRFSGTPTTQATHGLGVTATNAAGSATDQFNVIVSTGIDYSDFIVVNGRTGVDAGANGSPALPFKTIGAGVNAAKSQSKICLLQDEFFLTSTQVLGSTQGSVQIWGDPTNTPIVSGGIDESSTLERSVTGSSVWSFSAPSGNRHHMVEITLPGGTPKTFEEVWLIPSGHAEADFPNDQTAPHKSGWIRLNQAAAGTVTERGRITGHGGNLTGLPLNGQIWGVHCLSIATNAVQYFWYGRTITAVSGDEITFGTHFSGAPGSTISGRPIRNGCRIKILNWPLWLLHSQWASRDGYSYAGACWKLGFAGASTFVNAETVTQDVSGASGRVMASTTGEVFLVQCSGTFVTGQPVKSSGGVTRAIPTSVTNKGNRLVARSASNLTGSRVVVGSLNCLLEINANNVQLGEPGYPIHFRNSVHAGPHDTTARKGEAIICTGTNLYVRNCKFVGLGRAWKVTGAGWRLISNEISYCDTGGEVASGNSASEIGYNYLHDQRGPVIGYLWSGLYMGTGSGYNVHHNKLELWRDNPSYQVNGVSNVTWEYNVFYNCQLHSADAGNGFYTTRPTTNGVIRYNWFQGGRGLDAHFTTEPLTVAGGGWRGQAQLRAVYLDDGNRFWNVLSNVFVWVPNDGTPMGRSPIMAAHARGEPGKTPAGDTLVQGNLILIRNNGGPETLDRNRCMEIQADIISGVDGVVQNVVIRGNILINVGTKRTGYLKKESSGPATAGLAISYNVNKDNGVSATNPGYHSSTNDIFNPAYELIANDDNGDDSLFNIDPRLHSNASAQALKLARGSGGIGWVEFPYAEIQTAGLLDVA